MPQRAWAYIWTVFVLGVVVSGLALPGLEMATSQWPTFTALTVLATLAQLFKAEAPNHQTYFASPIFFFAGLLLLHPFLVVLLVAIPHLVEWAKERLLRSPLLRKWYLQPFNIAKYLIASFGAHWLYTALHAHDMSLVTPASVVAVTTAAVAYVALNQLLLGLVLVLARGVSWRDSAVLDSENLQSELVLVCLGYIVAVVWPLDPWLLLPALSPVVLMYQALKIPQLKQEAHTDGKTGLFNAHHFNSLFTSELDRARRFERPLAFVMADLDLLREVNNTYGHLAGDAVIAGIGQIIRRTIREYDVAGRFGGEEFALVVPEAESAVAEALAERLRQAIEAARFEVPTSPTPVAVTMSLGVACFPHDGATAAELAHAADVAVYQAKADGRNRVVCAADVPRAIWVQQAAAAARSMACEVVAAGGTLEPRGDGTRPAACAVAPAAERRVPGAREVKGTSVPGTGAAAQATLRLFVGAVIAAGVGAALLGLLRGAAPQPALLVGLTSLAGIAELLQVDLYGRGTVSVSMGLTFAAALLTGVPGVACVSAAIILAHHLRQGRRLAHLHRMAFNWGAHVLAGLAPVLLIRAQGIPLQGHAILQLALPAVVAALAYYAIETGLIATALSLAEGTSPLPMWRAQYRWLAGHYLVLGLMGLALSIAYTGLGLLGVFVFALPVFMMHYVQKQYIIQTEESVQALERLSRDLSRSTLTDRLTGLGNQQWFQEELQREIARAARHGDPLVLARIDLDEFKVINERHGHGHGDRLLANLATVLRSSRAADRAFRLGSDEFALILPHTLLTDAAITVERLREDARRFLDGATVSVGLAALPVGDGDADLLHDKAGAALFEAKRRGRNTVVTFDEVEDGVAITSSAQAHAMHRLLDERQVSVVFQPIWDLSRGRILAFEALTRPAATYGLGGPEEVFAIAERMRRAHDLDALCRQAILARATELPPKALLFMNVSPQTLDHALLTGTALVEAAAAAGLAPERVVLELTERSMARPAQVVREATRLRALGFKLALDDTGSGNAGLEMLSRLHVDFVKIDRAVVAAALTNRAARAVLAGIIAIARETGTYVIAEGIETAAMLTLVRQASVQGVQGYLLGRPNERLPDLAAVDGWRALVSA